MFFVIDRLGLGDRPVRQLGTPVRRHRRVHDSQPGLLVITRRRRATEAKAVIVARRETLIIPMLRLLLVILARVAAPGVLALLLRRVALRHPVLSS